MGTSLNRTLGRWLTDAPAPAADCARCPRLGKCCDFQPFVPSFLLGAALVAGRSLPAPSWKYALQPIGLVASARFRAARARRLADGAGRDPAAVGQGDLCVFFAGGACTIWAWRPGECSTYSCAGENPDLSARAFALETTLSQMALVEQGFGDDAIQRQIDILNEPGDQLADADDAETIYRRAWEWARGLRRTDIEAWLEDV